MNTKPSAPAAATCATILWAAYERKHRSAASLFRPPTLDRAEVPAKIAAALDRRRTFIII